MTVSERIEQLKSEALSAVYSSASTADLEDVRVRFLGRSAELTEIKKSIGALAPEERKEVGGLYLSRHRGVEDGPHRRPHRLGIVEVGGASGEGDSGTERVGRADGRADVPRVLNSV